MSSGARTLRLLNRIADERVKVATRRKGAPVQMTPSGDQGPPPPATGQPGVIIQAELFPRMLFGDIAGIIWNPQTRTILYDWVSLSDTYSGTTRIGDPPPTISDPLVSPT